jgi:hypothetical protein
MDQKIKDAHSLKGQSWRRFLLRYGLLVVLTLAMYVGLRLAPEALWPRYLLLLVIAYLLYLRFSGLRSLWKDWVTRGDVARR